jgi:hypothetical protein
MPAVPSSRPSGVRSVYAAALTASWAFVGKGPLAFRACVRRLRRSGGTLTLALRCAHAQGVRLCSSE